MLGHGYIHIWTGRGRQRAGADCGRDTSDLADVVKELMIRLMERMLTAHLGYEEGKEAPPGQANRRNGSSTKVLKGQDGELPVAVPRDRSFEPELVKKRPDPH